MSNLKCPSDMARAVRIWVQNFVYYVTCDDVYRTVDDAVYVATEDAVYEAVYWAVDDALKYEPPHPNLDKFIMEIGKNWSEPWIT